MGWFSRFTAWLGMASLIWLLVGLVSPMHDLALFLSSVGSLIRWSQGRLSPSMEALFELWLVLYLVMSPWPKLLMWLKWGLGVRELPNGVGSGWAVILSILQKTWPQASFFSILLVPLPYQPAPVICNCVCMCECIFLSFCRGWCGEDRGLGIGVAIKMNWESIIRTYLSPPL